MLVETNAEGDTGDVQFQVATADGTFDFAHVHSGRYQVLVTGREGEKPEVCAPCPSGHFVGAREVVVGSATLDGIEVEQNSPATLTGEIHFEDIPKEWRFFRVEDQKVDVTKEFTIEKAQSTPMAVSRSRSWRADHIKWTLSLRGWRATGFI